MDWNKPKSKADCVLKFNENEFFKRLIKIILDIIPNKECHGIKWDKIKRDIHKNNNFLMNRSLYPLISLAIILNKYNLTN